jgi:hypothetical protein
MNSLTSSLKNWVEIGFSILIVIVLFIGGFTTEEKASSELFNPAKCDAQLISSPTGDIWFLKDGILVISFNPQKYSSIITIRPPNGLWDASGYRFIECEIENPDSLPQLVELGFGNYDLTLGGTLVSPGEKKTLKAVIYRNQHPAYIDSLFPVMHGKPDGTLRSWMKSTCDSIECIKLIFPGVKAGARIKIGRIWFEDPYILYSANELKKKYYPFVDRFGQFIYEEWPDKIHDEADLTNHDEKERKDLEEHPRSLDWNKYGGWETGPQLGATGRFRVEKYNGKWWFVDPEGKLFWSNGFDCVEFGRQSQTRVSGREGYFEYLPSSGSSEAQLYYATGKGENTLKHLSFHSLNLFRKYGESWREVSNERIHQRMSSWGFNTIGNWSDREIYLKRRTPYVLTAYTKKTGEISDPFLPEYQDELLKTLANSKEELADPWCIGVFIDNELKWGVKWAPKIAEQILVAPASQPAKKAFREMLERRYTSISDLNKAWDTDFNSWEQIMKNNEVTPGAAADTKIFMNKFATRYYSICQNAVRKIAPGLLYLGCRMDFHLYPEDTSLNDIIRIASRYCDVVSFNRYRYTCAELIPPDGGDYPLIIGEYHFGTLETGLLQPGLRYAANQNERAELFGYYFSSALKNPYIIGNHWFQLVDQSVAGRSDGENYQAGFLTVGDVPQQEMISKSREIGYNIYKIRE